MDRKTLARKWIKALRSGKYKQGRQALVFEGKYCCLGVLCDVAKEDFNLTETESYFKTSQRRYDLYLPTILDKFLKLNKKPSNSILNFQESLIDLNDSQEKNFKFIANYIEENILPTL